MDLAAQVLLKVPYPLGSVKKGFRKPAKFYFAYFASLVGRKESSTPNLKPSLVPLVGGEDKGSVYRFSGHAHIRQPEPQKAKTKIPKVDPVLL